MVDAGTTTVKAALLEPGGAALATASVEQPVQHPGPGRAEQHPDDWWRAFRSAVRGCRVAGAAPVALAVTGQMQDLVVLDQHDRPARPALLYSDLRAGAELAELTGALGDGWSMATGNVADPSSTCAQLRWVREHEPEVLTRTHRVLLGSPGYLLHRAGGRASCDLTTASTTGLLDIHRRTWWPPVLEVLGLDPGLLPELVDGVSEVGESSRAAAEELELPAALPLVHVAGDAAAVTAGLIGAAPGAISVSLGTSGWVAALTGWPSRPNGAIHHLVGPTGRESLLIGALLSAGATVEWARRTYLPGASRAAADRAAELAGPTDLLMLPSLAGERSPVRDPLAVGAVVGLRPSTTPAQLYRAAMEGVGYSLRRILEIMGPDLPASSKDSSWWLPVSGGGALSGVFGRIVADVLGRPVAPVAAEGAGLHGAYRAAASALGMPVPAPLVDAVDPATVMHPSGQREHYDRLADAHAELWAQLRPAFRALAGR